MPQRLFRYYQRSRLLNTNVNVAAAGITALVIVKALIWAIHGTGAELPPLFYTVFALVADIVVDLAIFFVFHWIANHWRPLEGRTHRERKQLAAKPPDFLKDAAIVQAERTLLSPVYYVIATVLMHWLQTERAWDPGWAFVAGYATGLVVTRIIHTVWGLWTGRFKDNRRRDIERRLKQRRAERLAHARNLGDADAERATLEAETPGPEPARR